MTIWKWRLNSLTLFVIQHLFYHVRISEMKTIGNECIYLAIRSLFMNWYFHELNHIMNPCQLFYGRIFASVKWVSSWVRFWLCGCTTLLDDVTYFDANLCATQCFDAPNVWTNLKICYEINLNKFIILTTLLVFCSVLLANFNSMNSILLML